MKKCPCNGCADRMLMCHTICRAYKAWREEYKAQEAAKRAEQEARPMSRTALKAWIRKMKGRKSK